MAFPFSILNIAHLAAGRKRKVQFWKSPAAALIPDKGIPTFNGGSILSSLEVLHWEEWFELRFVMKDENPEQHINL